MSRIFPKKETEETTRTSVTLPDSLWKRIAAIAEEQKYPRDEAMRYLLKWACDEYDAEKKSKK